MPSTNWCFLNIVRNVYQRFSILIFTMVLIQTIQQICEYFPTCVYSEVPSRGSTQTTISSGFVAANWSGQVDESTVWSHSFTTQSLGT